MEVGRGDFEWVHGYYRLTHAVVPRIATAARAAGLGDPFVPLDAAAPWVTSMQCFMRCDTMKRHNGKSNSLAVLYFDLTDGNCDGKWHCPTAYESWRAAGVAEFFRPHDAFGARGGARRLDGAARARSRRVVADRRRDAGGVERGPQSLRRGASQGRSVAQRV